MLSFFSSRWIQAAILLVIFGWGPLFTDIFLHNLGVLQDPNPNPVGYGLLFAITFFPAILCFAIGLFQTLRRRKK